MATGWQGEGQAGEAYGYGLGQGHDHSRAVQTGPGCTMLHVKRDISGLMWGGGGPAQGSPGEQVLPRLPPIKSWFRD